MDNFPKYYTQLFNGVTDAIEALQKQDCIKAEDILIRAQHDAENMYLADGEEGEDKGSAAAPVIIEFQR